VKLPPRDTEPQKGTRDAKFNKQEPQKFKVIICLWFLCLFVAKD